MLLKYERDIDTLLQKMSLDEKIGQLNQMPWPSNEKQFEDYIKMIKDGKIGSIILTGSATSGKDDYNCSSVEKCNELQRIAVENSRNGIPLLFGLDVIHGHKTVLPIPLASAASFNPELIETCYHDIAEEAAADGIHWTFSPMVDMSRDPRWGRIVEGPGEDPYVGEKFAEATVKGFQGIDLADDNSVIACAKHYIGYGASEGGRDYHRTEISDYSLYNYYLPAFKAAVNAGVGTIMSSFNDISGQPITSSRKYLTDILRGKLGFDGYVVSDWGSVQQLQKQGVAQDRKECAKLALLAGLDMDMCSFCYKDNLKQLYESGEVSEEDINLAVRRILRLKYMKGLFDSPFTKERQVDRKEHIINTKTLASESIVLLKNNDVLPLCKSSKIALLGPFAFEKRSLLGTWTLNYILSETPSLYEALTQKIGADNVLIEQDKTRLFDTAIPTANNSDIVVLALGESWQTTGECSSVTDISLSQSQVELIRKVKTTGKKVIGVFFCGRPIAMDGVADYLDAVVYAWHGGSQISNAVCDVLFGDSVPSGKTPVTFPRNGGQIPLYYNVTSSGRYVNGYYGENQQITYNDSLPTPYYPFGYGLSYTEFVYGIPKTENDLLAIEELEKGNTFKIEISIKNIGKYDAKEIVQLYVYDPYASVMRPLKELKDFKKVFIKCGETANVKFEIGKKQLGFYSSDGNFILEKGDFYIYIGKDCLDDNWIKIQLI